MNNNQYLENCEIAYIEIYTHMAKMLSYWHEKAMGFTRIAKKEDLDNNTVSYLLRSKAVNLVLTSTYPTFNGDLNSDIGSYIYKNSFGVKRIALKTENVIGAFDFMIQQGAIPIKEPSVSEDEFGAFEFASIKLYDDNEIILVDDKNYAGVFQPGYVRDKELDINKEYFSAIDHVAAELKINEIQYWTNYVSNTIGTKLIQSIERSTENTTAMLLNINQSENEKLTLVMAEPDYEKKQSKIQNNINKFGAGIHHIAFSTDDIFKTLEHLMKNHVDLVELPSSYYDILRENKEMKDMDIDLMEKYGVLVDKQESGYLLQKFIKPIADRPYFFYEIVQRVNSYKGFALNNIKVLKKAEERQIIKEK